MVSIADEQRMKLLRAAIVQRDDPALAASLFRALHFSAELDVIEQSEAGGVAFEILQQQALRRIRWIVRRKGKILKLGESFRTDRPHGFVHARMAGACRVNPISSDTIVLFKNREIAKSRL